MLQYLDFEPWSWSTVIRQADPPSAAEESAPSATMRRRAEMMAMRTAQLDHHANATNGTRINERQHQQHVEWSRQHAGLKKHGWLLERDLAKFYGTSSDVQQVMRTTMQHSDHVLRNVDNRELQCYYTMLYSHVVHT